MNILFTKFPLESHFGGGEKHTIQLAEGLVARGHQVVLFSSDPILIQAWQEHQWPFHQAWLGLEPTSLKALVPFTIRLPYTLWQLHHWTTLLAKQYHISVVYSQSLTEKITAPLVWHNAGWRQFWIEHVHVGRWLLKNPYRGFYRWWSRYVKIITVSQSVQQEVQELGIAAEHTEVIYNGVDMQYFQPASNPKNPLPILGTTARLEPEKGIATCLSIIHALKEAGLDVEYHIAGDGSLRTTLERQATELGIQDRVKFLGFISDVRPFLQTLDLFLLTSERESFGISVAEANAMQVPAVVNDIPGLKEVVADGINGALLPAGDITAFVARIRSILSDPAELKKLRQSSRQHIAENFSLEKMIDQYERLFSES